MGIQGLLPLLKPIHIHTNLSAFSGKTLAVDGYVWLHRGAYACAVQLVKGQYTTKYVDYAMHRVRMLRHHGITPYMVFDGGPLPAKRGTERDREEKRAANLSQAQALEAQGRNGEAYEYYKKCVDITPQMAYQLIKALRAEGIFYVVAPYEADAQMAYLEREGIVDGIVTEDSDLVVFGCKNLLFKLGNDGSCVHVRRDDLAGVKDVNLSGWGDKEFRWMAMLSGCDYINSVQGLGLKTAYKLLRKWKTVDKASTVVQVIRMDGAKVPSGYLESFRIAELAFLHQRVYDPVAQKLTHLGPPPEDEDWNDSKDAFVGEDLPAELAKMIAEGDACPISRQPMPDIMPSFQPKPRKGKAALKETPSNSSIKSVASQKSISTYFSAASISSQPKKPKTFSKTFSVKGSGKTSLSAQMTQTTVQDDDDWEVMEVARPSQPIKQPATASRFFGGPSTPRKSRSGSATTPERKRKRADSLEEISTLVHLGQFPVSTRKPAPRLQKSQLEPTDTIVDRDHGTPNPVPVLGFSKPARSWSVSGEQPLALSDEKQNVVSVDLTAVFSQESISDVGTSEGGPWTPADPPALTAQIVTAGAKNEDLDDADYISDEEEQDAMMTERQAKVAEGWASKYGFKAVKGRKSMPAMQPTQSTPTPAAPLPSSSRPITAFQPLAMPKSRLKVKGRKSEPALTKAVIDIDDDDEDFLIGDTRMSSPERAVERFNRLKCPV
ncbi:exonuclease 1 [Ceratobasidium sp. AG-Ba]|nr:exonuclease 1 [Ceratobasidium sp. AG-Ba]